jgi:hypothetical protein
VDNSGQPVMLRGVFFVSFEVPCTKTGGISSQTLDQQKVSELLSWHINFVRIGVPEDCWLGINGEPYGTTVSAYQQALKSWVELLHANGIYTEIGLMYSAPGTNPSVVQAAMPDEDHAPAFWTSFATYFKDEPDTIFGISGQTAVRSAMRGDTPTQWWTCWLEGGSACQVSYPLNGGTPYDAAGMQQLVNTIRATGANQPIAVMGERANDLSNWLQYEPTDPDHALIADWHQYGLNACFSSQDTFMTNNETCWDGAPLSVSKQVPLLNGEVGEGGESDQNLCAWSFTPTYLTWAESHTVGYAVWKFGVDDTAGPCTNMALITDEGYPTPIYGQNYKVWLEEH